MDAYVSGQAGRAVCLDGERAFLIDVNALDAEIGLPIGLAGSSLSGATDVVTLRSVTRGQVADRLKHEWNCDRALRLTLILLDPDEDIETKRYVLPGLNKLLTNPQVGQFVETRLASRPLPLTVDLEATLELATPAKYVRSLLGTVEDREEDKELVPLQWDPWAEETGFSTPFARLTLRTGNSPINPVPGQINLSLDLDCPLVEIERQKKWTLSIGLKRCFLTFDCGRGHTNSFSTRIGSGGGVQFDGARFSAFGTSVYKPSWEINAIGPGVIGKVQSVPATFIQIDHLTPGSTIKARISVNVKEILTNFVLPNEPASYLKHRVKIGLHKLGIVGDEYGDANVATSEVKLMAKSDAMEPAPSRVTS